MFDNKTKYQFQTQPGVDKYNMPLYSVQSGVSPNMILDPAVAMYPVYQGFTQTAYINGIPVTFNTEKTSFFNYFPNVIQNQLVVAVGDGTTGPYTINLNVLPSNTVPTNPPVNAIIRGHVDITGIMSTNQNVDPPIASDSVSFGTLLGQIPTTSIDSAFFLTSTGTSGQNVVVADSGIFLADNHNIGMLMEPWNAPYGNSILVNGSYSVTENTINYLTGKCKFSFNEAIPKGVNINAQYLFIATGLPRALLYYNNTIQLRAPPDRQYLVELDAYLSPAAFFNTAQAIPFGYMAEYIARGAARKILSDTGDAEQFQFYEPFFIEQENLVWKRSQRQWTSTRTQTLYSQGGRGNSGNGMFNGSGTSN